MMSSAMQYTFRMSPMHSSSLRWNTSPATETPKGILVNLYRPKLQLKVVSRDDSSVSSSCQYPFEQSTTVIAVAPASFEDSSSGTMYL